VTLRSRPVSLFFAFTDALGTTAPFVSVMTPEIWPELACDCPKATALKASSNMLTKNNFTIFDMGNSLDE
jgi:hypothetical protein